MNTSMRAGIILAAIMLIVGLAQTGCRDIPNEELTGNLRLTIDVPGAPAADAPVVEPTIKRLSGAEGVDLAEPFLAPMAPDRYHVKVSLTNPDETFYIMDYTPGSQTSLLVASGSEREIKVEVYMVYGSPSGFALPAMHYLSDQVKIFDFQGEPVAVNISVSENSDLGALYDFPPPPPVLKLLDGYTTGLPVQLACPPVSFPETYYARITDDVWGLSFPPVEVAMQSGYTLSFELSGLPLYRPFTIKVFHSQAGISSVKTVKLTTPSETTDFVFSGLSMFEIKKATDINLSAVPPLTNIEVPFKIVGGLGGYMASVYWGPETCSGATIIGNVYYFTSPPVGMSCTIDILAQDCTGGAEYDDHLILNVTSKVPASPRTFFVSKTGSDSNPGTQAAPFLTIGKAVSISYTKDIIKVAAGVYNENVPIYYGVNLRGGFNPSTWNRDVLVHRTVLKGTGSGSGFIGDMSMGTIAIDGFIIDNFYRGIDNYNSAMAISNNIITNNTIGVGTEANLGSGYYIAPFMTPAGTGYGAAVSTLSHNLLVRNGTGMELDAETKWGKVGYTYNCYTYELIGCDQYQCSYGYYQPDCQGNYYYGQNNCYSGPHYGSTCYLGSGYYDYGCTYTTGVINSTNNTIHQSQYYGVSGYAYTPYQCSSGSGSVKIRNDIFAGNNSGDVRISGRISNDIQYSLFESGYPSGATLLRHAPNFSEPMRWGQLLLWGDTAIKAGDPASTKNPDGTRNTMGWQGGASIWFDSDYDGMPDTWEVKYGLNPNSYDDRTGDLDGDSLQNYQEFAAASSPISSDTDGDGMPDSWEAGYLDCVYPWISDDAADPDGDSFSNYFEWFTRLSNPCVPD